MKIKLKKIFDTITFRQTLITFPGTIINGFLGAIFYFLAARILGPSNFGLLIIPITTLTLIADVGDLGTDTGLVRFIGKYKADKLKVKRFLKLGLKIKLVIGLLVIFIGSIFAPNIASNIFLKPEITSSLRLAFFGVGSTMMFSFIIHSLQGFQRFWLWSGLQIGTNALRLILFILLIILGVLSVESTLGVFVAVPILGFLFGIYILPKGFFKVKNESLVAKEFFHYNKWIAAFTLLAAISSRLDIFISARLLPSNQVGFYSAASQLTIIVPQLVVALGTVIAPKMAAFGNLRDFISYFKKTQLLVIGIALMGLLSIPLVVQLIPFFYGQEYIQTIPLFIILFVAMLIFLISVPVHNSVFYYFAKPELFFYISLGHLVITAILGWKFISTFGSTGAAITVLIGSIFNFIAPTIWVVNKLRK